MLERRTSALTGGTCAGFSGGWTPSRAPTPSQTDTCAQYRYRVSDHVGNEAIYTSTNVVKVDQTAPNTSIGSTPSDPTNATGATFTFSATETGSTFECELDGGGFSSCSSPESYAGLAEGSHTFKVRATDVAGNTDASPAPVHLDGGHDRAEHVHRLDAERPDERDRPTLHVLLDAGWLDLRV